MVKDLVGRAVFTRKYEEDLDDILEMYVTYTGICDLSRTQMRKAMPIMLGGNSLSLFNKDYKACKYYDEGITLIMSRYSSREKQTRLLRDWEGMRLTTAIQAESDA